MNKGEHTQESITTSNNDLLLHCRRHVLGSESKSKSAHCFLRKKSDTKKKPNGDVNARQTIGNGSNIGLKAYLIILRLNSDLAFEIRHQIKVKLMIKFTAPFFNSSTPNTPLILAAANVQIKTLDCFVLLTHPNIAVPRFFTTLF